MPELSSPPSLLPLYAKAAVTSPLHRGGSLPDSVYSLADQKIDPAHLAAFQQVCGYPVTDVLPPTYLHVLAFPLSVALMTERAFPFPLVGMVHVANSITLARAVRSDETVSFRVRVADLRPHAAGQQFDLLAEATVRGDVVWSGRSTYLRRGGAKSKSDKRAELGPQTGSTSVVRVPADIGRRYGAVSGDRNPIHLHNLAAKAFGFPAAIAHGMWLKARTLAALEGRLPDAYTVEVAFKLPVLLPASLSVSTAQESDGWTLDVRDAKSGKPHVSGTVSGAAVPAAEAKQAPAKKTPAKKTPAKKADAKAPATKAPAKKTPAKNAPAKSAPAKNAPAKKVPTKKSTPSAE